MDPVFVLSTDDTYVKKFRMYGSKITFKFNKPPTGYNELDWIKKGFGLIVERMKEETEATDYLGFTLRSLNFKNREPGYVAFRPADQISEQVLWDIFGGIVQSNSESITSSDTFTVECTRINLPVGSGRKKTHFYNTFEEECKSRKGIITIKNKDNLCLPRALIVAKALIKETPDMFKAIRQDKGNRQTLKAEKLLAKARVEIPKEGAGIQELEKLQAHLKKYKITVYNYNSKGREVYFNGENTEALYKINLLFHNRHYNVIKSLTAAFACRFFCEACHIPYDHPNRHQCSSLCPACFITTPPCRSEHGGIECPSCHRHLKNQRCFIAHKSETCKSVQKCVECDRTIRPRDRKSKHVCGEIYCTTCHEYFPPNHRCHMKVDIKKPMSENFSFIFFDFETRQDELLREGDPSKKVHKVNLCVSKQYCYKCVNNITDTCDQCSRPQRVFREEEAVRGLINYVMEERQKYKSLCVMAHNGQGYDFQFVLKYIIENTKFTPDLITRGTKIILMQVDNVRFIDSINYFPMALSALPKAFDLGPEKKKGYFPHLFNTLANKDYIGPMPDREYFCPDTMFKNSREKFDLWYDSQISINHTFDLQKELLEYCISDVDILSQACLKFRSLFLVECNVDPFLEAVTIASACNLAFRRKFLKPNTIGLVPKRGYRMAVRQSAKALQWMSWEEEKRNVKIRHAGNGREARVAGAGKVDGFDGKVVYEFHGCYYHGCPKCFPYKRGEPLQEDLCDSLEQRLERTKKKTAMIRRRYEVVEMWECEFEDLKKKHKLDYLSTLPILNMIPLKPRDAFFGGRTGNSKTYHKCTEPGETIQYVDVCSLYPWVCKYGKYPLGHPEIYVGNTECQRRGLNAEGLLKCVILPPQQLYHPVLPARMHDKLMFVLCHKCGEELNTGDCLHSEEERALTGTWTMQEIRKAVEKGYRIIEMLELWEYKMASYEYGDGLFTEFINKFLKIKQEASGFPEWCVTEQDKDRYIEDYYRAEGIQLEKDKIRKNAGLRSLAKLMLNSFWGKFGQRENQAKTLITRDPEDLFKMLVNPSIQINRLKEINENVVLVNWEYLEEASESLRTVNVVLAAFTTSQARLKLYEYLDSLQSQVCYYDTDSVIYIYKDGLFKIPTGDFLGEMTDELANDYGSGSFIQEFVSGGPKTYAYRVYSTDKQTISDVCKIKGLTLNLNASRKLNFDVLKKMVLKSSNTEYGDGDEEEEEEGEQDKSLTTVEIHEHRIRRTTEMDVVSVQERKDFRVTGPKRKHSGHHDTVPYGFKRIASSLPRPTSLSDGVD